MKLIRQNSGDATDSDGESEKSESRSATDQELKWKNGDKVMAKFRDDMQQGTISGVFPKRKPPYDVYLDALGITYQMHSDELEECLNPQEYSASELKQFLETLNLQEHHKSLVAEGFEDLEDLENIQFEDLRAVGFKRGHARRLIKALEEYKMHPDFTFDEINNALQRRPSMAGHRESLMAAGHRITSSFDNASSVSFGQPPQAYSSPPSVPNILPESQRPNPLVAGMRSRSDSQATTGSTFSQWEEDGFLIIPFDRRPLGFGIMSPLFVGTMVSTITDDGLKKKGLGLGLPLLSINNYDVTQQGLEEIAGILSSASLPFTVTFGLQPYFKPGQKVMVQTNNRWYPATVVKMSKSSRKVTVKYDNNPFKFSNTEKISDYNRIKDPGIGQQYAQAAGLMNQQNNGYLSNPSPMNGGQAGSPLTDSSKAPIEDGSENETDI